MSQSTTTADTSLVMGRTVQHDPSGQGHAWRTVDASQLNPAVVEEIEGEIVDGGADNGQIVASNGQHYRWY